MYSGIWAIVITSAAVFGGCKLRDWLREKAGQVLDRRDAEYKRNFRKGMDDINRWRRENPPKTKQQNIICKNPAFAAAWEIS